MSRLALILAGLPLLAGCPGPAPRPCEPTVVEVPVVERVPVPAECLAPCAEPAGTPATNGELLEAYAARGLEVACLRARLECVSSAQRP